MIRGVLVGRDEDNMSIVGVATSGVLTASTLVSSARCKLVSVHATSTTNALFTVKIWDSANSTISGKKEVLRLHLHAGGTAHTIEQDMHGALLAQGCYVEFDAGAGSCTVNYA